MRNIECVKWWLENIWINIHVEIGQLKQSKNTNLKVHSGIKNNNCPQFSMICKYIKIQDTPICENYTEFIWLFSDRSLIRYPFFKFLQSSDVKYTPEWIYIQNYWNLHTTLLLLAQRKIINSSILTENKNKRQNVTLFLYLYNTFTINNYNGYYIFLSLQELV